MSFLVKNQRSYIAIDLKSFYASVECVERGLDPLTTHLVVADASRTEKTICLAVTPSLKSHGISGRARLFEVVQRVREINHDRRMATRNRTLVGKATDSEVLKARPDFALDYIVAPPRMALYVNYSTRIYSVYLRFVALEDIHIYSVDEVFIDATNYLRTYNLSPQQLAARMIGAVLKETGITATAGIGTNLYLCKVAMDIVAKHVKPDDNGMRIATLDERLYRELLWSHRPLTDFWRVGHGIACKLEANGMMTMGDVARKSLTAEGLLYKLFGINAELLIDHAWGYESCLMSDIKKYRPEGKSFSHGQVLQCPYTWEKARVVLQEMTDSAALDLVDRGVKCQVVTLMVGYDVENTKKRGDGECREMEVSTDHYGRQIPHPVSGSRRLNMPSSSSMEITAAVLDLFDSLVDHTLTIRRLYLGLGEVVSDSRAKIIESAHNQLNLFEDCEQAVQRKQEVQKKLDRERRLQEAVLAIKKRYNKNAILKGISFKDGATARDRNRQIGGHKA